MQALTLSAGLEVRDVAEPEPEPGCALIRVRLAGICNTDLELALGYMEFDGTLGHEFVGVVEHCDDESWIGRRVVGEINLGCTRCEACRTGLARHCPERRVLGILNKDGCLAERVSLPVANLERVPDALSDEAAVFTEPLAAAFEILEQIDVNESDRVLVLGDGKLGLLCVAALATTGCELQLHGRHAGKLAHGERFGARTSCAPDLPHGRFDVVVEASGRPGGLEQAIALTRPRGTVILKSTFHGATPVVLAPVVIDEITVIGSRCGRFPAALQALAGRAFDPTPLISERFSLGDAVAAMERSRDSATLKVLVECSD